MPQSVWRELLVSSVTLTTERLQETMDDAVRRGRMTRRDAEELLGTLLSAGRSQTEALLTEMEGLMSRREPIAGYDELRAADVVKQLDGLSPAQLRRVRAHEEGPRGPRAGPTAVDRPPPRAAAQPRPPGGAGAP